MKNYFKSVLVLFSAAFILASCEENTNVEPQTLTEAKSTSAIQGPTDHASDDIIRVDYGQVVGYKFTLPRFNDDFETRAFFSTSLGKKYKMNSIALQNLYKQIDFFYVYEPDYPTFSLAAPDAYLPSYSSQKGVFYQQGSVNLKTRFKLTNLKVADLNTAVKKPVFIKQKFITNNNSSLGIQPVTEKLIYAFKTDASKTGGERYGLIRVLEATGDKVVVEVFVNKEQF